MDKKLKGDIAETSVIAKCVKLGYKVCIPVGDRFSYDLVLDIDNILLRIQIKSAYIASDGSIKCAGARRTLTNRVEIKYKKYEQGAFDFVIVYVPHTEDYYVIPELVFLESSAEFNLVPSGTQRVIKSNPDQYKNNWRLLENK